MYIHVYRLTKREEREQAKRKKIKELADEHRRVSPPYYVMYLCLFVTV